MANIDTKTFLNPDAIGTGTITGDKIKDNAITSAKIADNTITKNNISDGAVTNVKLADGAVNNDKLSPNAVSNSKIKDKVITGAKIKNETIWPNKLVYPTINSAFADANSDGTNLATNVGPVEVASMFDNNVAFYAKADGITVEYSRDGGVTWHNYFVNGLDNDLRKVNIVSNTTTMYYAGALSHQFDETTGNLNNIIDSSRTHGTPDDMLRFTFDAKGMGIYAMIMQIYVLISTSGSAIEENGSFSGKLHVKLESASMKSLDNFVTITDNITVTGWSGWNAIPINRRFGSSGWNTNDDFTGRLRLTFYCDKVNSTNEWFSVWQFKFLSSDAWAFPSEMAKNNHIYEAGIRDITYGNDNYGNPGLIATPSMILPGEIKPKTTNKYDNGTSTQQWRNIYGQNIYENGTSLSEKYLLNTDNVVTTAKINNNAVTSEKISNGAVTYTKLATDSVIAGKIKNGAVTTDKIADGAVTTEKIGGEAVTSDELADSAVINRKIHDNAITTAKIVDNAITTAKIHNLDVTNDKIANKTITGGKIKNQTIWSNKLTWQTLSDASSDVDSSGILYTPVGPVETAAMFDNNVLSLGRPDGLLVEYARDYGHLDDRATWYEYYFSNIDKNYSDIRKVNMMTNGNPDSYAYFAGGKNFVVNSDGTLNSNTDPNRKRASDGDALRFTFDAKSLGVYAQVVQIYAFISTNGSNITVNNSLVDRLRVKLETSTVSNPDSFTTVADNITVTGWSGWNAIPFNGERFGHQNYTNISNSNYVQKIRLTFTSEGAASDGNNWFQVYQFKFLATDAWGFPSELAKNKHLYKTEVTSIVDSKDSSGNNIRVPYTSMNTDGDIKANTIYEGNKKLSDKYVPYIDDGISIDDSDGKLKSYVGYGYQNNTGAYSGLFISGAHATGNYGGQLSGSFDGELLSYRAYNNGTFTDWKELAFKSQIDTLNNNINTKISTVESTFNTQITNLSNSTQKAVYDYLSSPDNISDTTTSPTLLAKSNGTHDGNLSFYDTKFYNSQSASSNRAQVAYGYDNDYIGYRRYYNGAWTDWRNVAFEDDIKKITVILSGTVSNPNCEVIGYNGHKDDIVIVSPSVLTPSGHTEIIFKNLPNGCLIDCIIDKIEQIEQQNDYDIYLPSAYMLTGKKITLIKYHICYADTITTKNKIYINPISNIATTNQLFFTPVKVSNDESSNINLKITSYTFTDVIEYNPFIGNLKTYNNISILTFISEGECWIVYQENAPL